MHIYVLFTSENVTLKHETTLLLMGKTDTPQRIAPPLPKHTHAYILALGNKIACFLSRALNCNIWH